MYRRLPRYAPVLLFLATALAAGCNRAPATPTSPSTTETSEQSITVEPALVHPEFLPTSGCDVRPAFAVRIHVRLLGGFFVRGLRFHFVDELGTRTLPQVVPILTPTGSSIPSASPVPVPGIAALPTAFQAGGSSPFLVTFGCGVIPEGTLFINADHNRGTTAMTIRIG